jgi:dihydroorotase
VSSMDTHSPLVLRNVSLPSGRVADVTLAEGRVTHVGAYCGTAEHLDCTGLLVLPAAIDMHVHMRGSSRQEDWNSGSRSALAGDDRGRRPATTVPPLPLRYTLLIVSAMPRANSWCGLQSTAV